MNEKTFSFCSRYLESSLDDIYDPYDLVLTTWALIKSGSALKDAAFSKLDRMKRVVGENIQYEP